MKKNKDIMNLYQAFSNMNYEGVKFNYFVAKNLSILGKEVEVIGKTLEASPEYNKYDEDRVAMASKYAKKTPNGEPVTEIVGNQSKFVMEDLKGFEKEFDKLRKSNKAILDARDKQIKDYEKLLDEDSKIELFKIKSENLPQDIKTPDMVAIFDLIEE